MALFSEAVNRLIRRDGITVRDAAHYEELYVRYRDDLFLANHGVPYLEWAARQADHPPGDTRSFAQKVADEAART